MIKQICLVLLGSLVALGAIGCSADHPENGNDAGIVVPDAARGPDTAVGNDTGTTMTGNVGAACTSAADCHGAATMCINNAQGTFPGGYCTAMCDPAVATSCPTGAQCQDFGGGQTFCVLTCDPAMTVHQCNGRMGYGCSSDPMFSGVCIGGCFDASDCPAGLMCDPMSGNAGAGACFTPGAAIGVACMGDTQCAAGGTCETEAGAGWPSGACLGQGCDLTMATGCPGDAQCIPFGGFGGMPQGVCVDGCATPADCRTGYTCTTAAAYPTRHYCTPACTLDSQCTGGRECNQVLGTCVPPFAGTLGSTCTRMDPRTCMGGTCLSERSSGFPNSYCSFNGCGAAEPCPGTGVCTARPGTTSVCLRSCTGDADCTTMGYRCRHSDPASTTSPMACVPACAGNSDCTRTGDVCNVGTGLCTAAFMTASEGMACTSDAGCTGGRCMTESGSGYSGGECVYPGCSLTTGVTGATCPASTACVDDHVGSPDLGICAPSCALGSATCRAGYACAAIPGSSTMGACQAMCTATSCTAPHTCDTGTALCH